MKKILFIAALFSYFNNVFAQTPCVGGMAGSYPCDNVDLLAFVPLANIGGGANTNDIWGWVSPVTHKEYALVGCSNGTAFLDISNPVAPVYLGILPPHTGTSLWRDLETYQNYCFIGSEASGHGMQIFDLLQLDNVSNPPLNFTETAHYNGFGNSHTLAIDTLNGFCYANGTNTFNGGLHIVDISNPLNPTLAGGFALEGYTHDCFVWNSYDGPDAAHAGKQIVLACNGNKLAVVDCTDKTDCESFGSYTYADLGYVHQGWVTKDKRHFVLNDELDEQHFAQDNNPIGTRTHIFDISDLDDLDYMGFHEAESPSIDHNMYIKDQFVYESNYRSGLRIFDAVRVADAQLNEVAFFDLYPINDAAVFSGTWSNYAFLPSGINIATSMYEGFFITRPNIIVPTQTNFDICNAEEITFDLTINGELAFPLTLAVDGLEGAEISDLTINETGTYSITISNLQAVEMGSYSPKLLLQTTFGEEYEVGLKVIISAEAPDAPSLNQPANETTLGMWVEQLFTWSASENASHYQIQISIGMDFSSGILVDGVVAENSYVFSGIENESPYYWRVRSINDCGESSWSSIYTFFPLIGSVGEIAQMQISVYPNPVESQLMIVANQTIGQWSISDLSGRMIESFTTRQKQISVDVEGLASGVYLLKAGNSVTRFVKQ